MPPRWRSGINGLELEARQTAVEERTNDDGVGERQGICPGQSTNASEETLTEGFDRFETSVKRNENVNTGKTEPFSIGQLRSSNA